MGKVGSALCAAMARVAAAIPALLWNMIGLAGAACIAYGAWLVYEPSGFIVAGILLLVGASMLAPRGA